MTAMAQYNGANGGAESSRGADSKQVNILVVDDLPDKLLVYQTILEDLGQNLMTARSGEEALKLVLQHEFAVILLDVNMPGMDGFETASLIRKRKRSSHTPIIFLTAFTDEIRMAQGYASGAVDYLPTPVIPGVLKAKVRVFIELSQMRRQAALQAEEHARRTAAEEADRRKDEFLGMLAHELRNPLGPILNASQLLRRLGSKDRPLVQAGDIIERQVMHMTRLIDDLLDANRIARGKILLRKERCDLSQIVRQTAEDYASIFDASGLTLEIRKPATSFWVEGDPTRLAQAIGNLLHNAHKFTNPGGTVTVSMERSEDGQSVVTTVADTGIGIDSKILPSIFDVFRQAEQGLDRSRGGLGLGLALVKGLVELHEGEIHARSDGLSKGSRFSIHLPLEQAPAKVAETRAAEVPSAKATKCRVLVIEDNRDAAESASMLLSMEGYEVKTAYTGSDGLAAARAFQPQVVLCDIGLPGMDGYEVARVIREDVTMPSPYIIALTGYGRDEDRKQAHEAGFDQHLTKPIDYNNLRRTLAGVPLRA